MTTVKEVVVYDEAPKPPKQVEQHKESTDALTKKLNDNGFWNRLPKK
jgi:hypothetical protein